MEESMAKIGYDVKRLPLGQLSSATVKEGFTALSDISDVLEELKKKGASAPSAKAKLQQLSDRFYTVIPHNFGMQKMANFVIDSREKVVEKLDLINNLIDINVAVKDDESTEPCTQNSDLAPNPLDKTYDSLKCNIKALDPKSAEHKLLVTYLNSSSDSSAKHKPLEVFSLKREGDDKKFNPLKLDNRKLLWHGSRFSNFVGILTNGMRIAPKEAPSTGYNFGKGAYFADMASKSSGYCCTHLSKGVGLMLLCEVALGKPKQLQRTDCHAEDNLPKGSHSTHAVGRTQPDPSGSEFLEKGLEVPMGKLKDVKTDWWGPNEWIVYNTNQIKLRYLIKFKH
jgi:hypothetical protein